MGWLSKVFKGSNHKVAEEQYNCNHGADTGKNHPSSSWDSRSEIEDINPALSLSKGHQKGKISIDSDLQLEEDELLSRAFQESLNVNILSEPQSTNNNDVGNGYGYGYGYGDELTNENLYQPITLPYSMSSRICAGCNTEIGHERFLSCVSALWHPECFRCCGCNQPISDSEFSMSGCHPYHKDCYKVSYHPKCDVCTNFIPTNAAGLIEYKAHPFWSQKYCPSHEHDGTALCYSCERMGSWDARFSELNDGRKLCSDCMDSAIMDSDECQPLFQDIQNFFKGLNIKISQQVPLLLVDRQALNKAMDGERHGHHHHMPDTRGLCLLEEQTITTISRKPWTRLGNRVSGMRTQPYKLKRQCEVTAILILYGLPRLLTGLILAHEMMHAWLRLNGYQTLRQDIEEGICQVIASMWLESQILSMSGNNSSFGKKLGEFLKQQIASDTSVVYGNGFRAGYEAVLKFGLGETLNHIQETGNFPY